MSCCACYVCVCVCVVCAVCARPVCASFTSCALFRNGFARRCRRLRLVSFIWPAPHSRFRFHFVVPLFRTLSRCLSVFLFCQSRTQIKLTSCLSIANSKLIRASGQFLAKWLAVSPAQPCCLLLVWIPVSPRSLSLFPLWVGGQRLQFTLVAPATAVATACSRCLLAPVLDTHRSCNVST